MIAPARVVGLGVALAAAVAIVRISAIPMTPDASGSAVLRLTWTARPERIEDCHSQSEEALASLPAHMRQSLVCEGTTAAYHLEVLRNGFVILQQTVRGGGLRHDRALYVSRDIELSPGNALITVKFVRDDANRPVARAQSGEREEDAGHTGMDEDRWRREREERTRGRGETVPPSLVLERSLRLVSRQAVLVTYNPERRELEVMESPSSESTPSTR